MPIRLGHHELLVRLAAGGAANVFLVRDLKAPPPGRLLALKVLLPNLAANEDFLNMFFTEARIATRLRHRNIVRIAGFGRSGPIHCLAMEYVFGASLSQVLRASARARKPLTVGVLLRIAADVCAALQYAHALRDEAGKPMGLVHRDVTPQNILIGFNGVPKLTDFGIAKATNRGWETQAGIVKGKFCYMSPEQALGKKVDQRSDIFCTGIVLWEALTGKELFKGSTPMEVLQAIREQPIVPPSKVVPGLSPIVDPIVMKALRRAPRQRYQTALELKEDVENLIRRAGVTIDESTIAREFGEIFGEVVVQRALALRNAMAGRADIDELCRALGGHKLNAEHLPDYDENEDYDEDPLGIFADEAPRDEFYEDGIAAALPAEPEQPFTLSSMAAIVDDEPAPDVVDPSSSDELAEIASLEFEEEADSDVVADRSAIDGWNDHTRMMEPSDELLAMLSEEDATSGAVSSAFATRIGSKAPPRSRGQTVERTADEADRESYDIDGPTITPAQAQRLARVALHGEPTVGRGRPRLEPRVVLGITAEDTVLQPRASFDLEHARRQAASDRPLPRAPSLDMDGTPLPHLDSQPTGRSAPLVISAASLLASEECDEAPSFRTPAVPHPFTTDPEMPDPALWQAPPAVPQRSAGQLASLPRAATPALAGIVDRPVTREAFQALAGGMNQALSPDALRQLAQEAPPRSPPVPGQGWPVNAAWPGTPPVLEPEEGVLRLRPLVFMLIIVAVFVAGVAVGVFITPRLLP